MGRNLTNTVMWTNFRFASALFDNPEQAEYMEHSADSVRSLTILGSSPKPRSV